jgi:hypothetical protein
MFFLAEVEVQPEPADPRVVDMLSLGSWEELSTTLRRWEPTKSDAWFFTTLSRPTLLPRSPDLSTLVDDGTPFLLLLEELKRRGWAPDTPENPLQVLVEPTAAVFSKVKLATRQRAYFKCLLCLGYLFHRGLTRFRHGLAAGYYSAIFLSPTPETVPVNQKAEEYEALIEGMVPAPPLLQERPDSDDSVVGSEHHPEEVDEEPEGPGEPGDVDSAVGSAQGDDLSAQGDHGESSSGGASSSSEASGSGGGSAVGSEHPNTPRMPALTFPLQYRGHTFVAKVVYGKPAIEMACPCAHHRKGCRKQRGRRRAQTSLCGEWEPVAFLLAWADVGAGVDRAGHNKAPVAEAAVLAWHDTLVNDFGASAGDDTM